MSVIDMLLWGNGGGGSGDGYTKAQTNALLAQKQDKLTFDAAPTEDSTNPVTSGGVYDELEQTVHVNAQDLTEQQKYTARQNIGAISANEVEHKRFGVSGVGQSSPTLTRLYNAVGMTATPSTDTVEGHSDFDAYSPFNRRKCVGSWSVVSGENKATFTVNAYEGDADYAEDGSMGDYVAVEVDPFYYYDQDGILAVSTYPFSGYKIHPVCLDYDGNIRAHTYIPCYALAQDGNGKAVSLPGFQNQRGGYKDLRDYAKTYNNDAKAYAMIEPTAVWHYEWMLQTIEFATQNMQSVMFGAADLRRNTNDVIVAIPAVNKVVLGSYGSNYVVGQTVMLGTYDASVDVTLYNRITSIEKCDASGNVDDSGEYYLVTYDGTDRSGSLTANTSTIESRPWCTGATAGYAPNVNAVLGHTGCPVHLTNGKYPMRYRWRENTYGNQNMTSLDLAAYRVSEGDDTYHLDWYFLADPRKYSSYDNYNYNIINDSSKGWVKLGVSTPSASYSNGFIKETGADTSYPYVRVPINTVGGSANTYTCDYCYIKNTTGVRTVRRGGLVVSGSSTGMFFFNVINAVSGENWAFGAGLYFLQ